VEFSSINLERLESREVPSGSKAVLLGAAGAKAAAYSLNNLLGNAQLMTFDSTARLQIGETITARLTITLADSSVYVQDFTFSGGQQASNYRDLVKTVLVQDGFTVTDSGTNGVLVTGRDVGVGDDVAVQSASWQLLANPGKLKNPETYLPVVSGTSGEQ
jgi:hypothetical protein